MNIEEGLFLARNAFQAGEPMPRALVQLRQAFDAAAGSSPNGEGNVTASAACTVRPRTPNR